MPIICEVWDRFFFLPFFLSFVCCSFALCVPCCTRVQIEYVCLGLFLLLTRSDFMHFYLIVCSAQVVVVVIVFDIFSNRRRCRVLFVKCISLSSSYPISYACWCDRTMCRAAFIKQFTYTHVRIRRPSPTYPRNKSPGIHNGLNGADIARMHWLHGSLNSIYLFAFSTFRFDFFHVKCELRTGNSCSGHNVSSDQWSVISDHQSWSVFLFCLLHIFSGSK